MTQAIPRDVFSCLASELEEPEVLVLLGPRQVGKTTLLRAMERHALDQGHTTLFFDLEQPRDLKTLSGDEEEVIEMLLNEADFVFIDEFYYLERAGHLFKAIYDRCCFNESNTKIIVSGSSSVEIHRHLQDGQSLAGRHVVYRIFPLTLNEYLSMPMEGVSLESYLTYGGMPGLFFQENEKRMQKLLENYVRAYLLSDVKGLVQTNELQAFNKLLFLLADEQGKVSDKASLSQRLDIAPELLTELLEVMEQTYTVFALKSFRPQGVSELKQYQKFYLYDLGIRNSILKDFRLAEERQDKKRVYDSFVVLSLIPRLAPNMELRFWQLSKGENVDFVLLINREPMPIVIDLNLEKPQISKSFESFRRAFPDIKKTYTVGFNSFEPIVEDGIRHSFVSFDEVADILPKPPRLAFPQISLRSKKASSR